MSNAYFNSVVFDQAVAILSAKFKPMPEQTSGDVAMFAISAKLAVFVRKSGKKFFEVGLSFEQRPGVWFHLGDMDSEVIAEYKAALGIKSCSVRNDIGQTNEDALAFARHLAA